MSQTDPNLTPLSDRLPADVYYCLVNTLRGILPISPDWTPEYLARRDNALIGRLAELRPATVIEAEIAADYIAATEHANDCLRLALDPESPCPAQRYEAPGPRCAHQARTHAERAP
jgi:hypothetical protein